MAKSPQRPKEELEKQREWSRRLTRVIGTQVRRYRDENHADLSAKELADRCEMLGYRVEQQVIANMEAGRRTSVALAELLVLARALDVPPVLLLLPIGATEDVEILPNVFAGPWQAFRWIAGEEVLPQRMSDERRYAPNFEWTDPERFREHATPIRAYREHSAEIETFQKAFPLVRTADGESDRALDRAMAAVDRLVRVRAQLAKLGLDVPELTGALADAVQAQERRESDDQSQ